MAERPTPTLENVFAEWLSVTAVVPPFADDIAENCNRKWVLAVELNVKVIKGGDNL